MIVQRRHQKIISLVGIGNMVVNKQSTTISIVQKRIVLLLLVAAISSCNAFAPPTAITPTMDRRGCNNDDRGVNNMIGKTTRNKVSMLMAQRMTPTRKTRKDDSFDRESGKEENEEKDGECFFNQLLVLVVCLCELLTICRARHATQTYMSNYHVLTFLTPHFCNNHTHTIRITHSCNPMKTIQHTNRFAT